MFIPFAILSTLPQLPSLHVCAVVRCRGCQAGTNYSETLNACVQTVDGNVVVAGYSRGYPTGEEIDEYSDIVAVKLDVNTGEKLWTSQVGRTTHSERRHRVYRITQVVRAYYKSNQQ